MSLKKDLELLYEIGCLRHVDRTWKQFHGLEVANVSEHTFRTIWMAMIIAKREGVGDIDKIIKMVLVHDLSESRSVDAHYLSRQFVDRFEDKALAESLEGTSVQELKELWEEFEKKETIEAKIAKDADVLDVDIEISELRARGHKIADGWRESREASSKKLFTNTAKEIFEELQHSNPHDWHLNGSNRLNAGDWKPEESPNL